MTANDVVSLVGFHCGLRRRRSREMRIGHYKVSGTTPEGSPYSGEVAIEFVGNTFHVVREVGGHRHIGTGIDFVSLSRSTTLKQTAIGRSQRGALYRCVSRIHHQR